MENAAERENTASVEWNPLNVLHTSRLYFEYARQRYEIEANHTNSMRTTVALAISSLIAIVGATGVLFRDFHCTWPVVDWLQVALFVLAVVLIGITVKKIHKFFTGFQHGYPITPSKAKKSIGDIEKYIDENYEAIETKRTRGELVDVNVYQYLGDAYSLYVQTNLEANKCKAYLLVSVWWTILWLISDIALLFVVQVIAAK